VVLTLKDTLSAIWDKEEMCRVGVIPTVVNRITDIGTAAVPANKRRARGKEKISSTKDLMGEVARTTATSNPRDMK